MKATSSVSGNPTGRENTALAGNKSTPETLHFLYLCRREDSFLSLHKRKYLNIFPVNALLSTYILRRARSARVQNHLFSHALNFNDIVKYFVLVKY